MITEITYCGQKAIVYCDKKCDKAWGINSRPIVKENGSEYYKNDNELDNAPKNPGTYEGGIGKAMFPESHNKWCVRECERSSLNRPGSVIIKSDFSKRIEV